ncbi:MAG: hypothetical protein N5P05_004401 (plasmid) [Chroococcopsis gigantea SAG 12.99]|jgi:hypothetical protein|nr:hypothetical protein [Chroococcopsis gigantea SAG 12.99]
MIDDLTRTLKALLERSPAETQITLGRPTESFKPERSSINLFLYDIRENLELRSNDTIRVQKNGNYELTYAPKRINCSYLVTAWPVGKTGEEIFLEEQRLLGRVLQTLSQYSQVPENLLQGTLKGQDGESEHPPVAITVSHPDSLKTLGEFWTAVGGQLRPSLSVTLIFTLREVKEPVTATIATSLELRFRKEKRDTQDAPSFTIRGRILDNQTPPQPVRKATVILAGANLIPETTETDEGGYYDFLVSEDGDYILTIQFEDRTQEKLIRIPKLEDSDYESYRRDYDLQLT